MSPRQLLQFYFDRGVAEVLIVDPIARTATWYGRGADRFSIAASSGGLSGLEDVRAKFS
jgi:hypothetical protein